MASGPNVDGEPLERWHSEHAAVFGQSPSSTSALPDTPYWNLLSRDVSFVVLGA